MGFDYGFEHFDYEIPTAAADMSGVLGVFIVIYLLFLLLALAFCVTSYVLHSMGLYSIAKRRGIRHPGLAWLPIGNMWLLGSISDQYQYVAKGLVRNRRKVLLWTMIVMYLLSVPICISALATILSAATAEVTGAMVGTLMILLCSLLVFAASIIGVIFQYIAYNNLFTSSDPNNAVAFLIIGIFIPVTLPFFVFACRKKDMGMPPRKPAPQPVFPQEEVATPEDFEL